MHEVYIAVMHCGTNRPIHSQRETHRGMFSASYLGRGKQHAIFCAQFVHAEVLEKMIH